MCENRCVCCGDIIPEGRQVCPICEDRAEQTSDRDCEQSPSEAHDGGDPRRGPKKVCPICEDRAEEAAQRKRREQVEEGSDDDGT